MEYNKEFDLKVKRERPILVYCEDHGTETNCFLEMPEM